MARKTKIIATIGPSTESAEALERLIQKGMNVARINMSHATHDQTREIVEKIRAISEKLGRRVSILVDTQGPAIRTGDLKTNLNLTAGDTIALTVRGEKSEEQFSVDVNYDDLVDDIQVEDIVLVDNGAIQLKVLEKRHNQLHCKVLTPGVLSSRRHINLPGVRVNLPALTDKDIADVELGIDLAVDFFAMSFVRDREDVLRLKAILDYRKAPQQVIAKLEDQEGIRNLDEIIESADGIMVARGDLGIECPYEELPIVQRRIVKHCIMLVKPVIVATHMLESMIESPSPTRAEVTDVANAVFEQADALMLSGETSMGRYPNKCLDIMDRICKRTEKSGGADYAQLAKVDNDYARLVKSASMLAEDVKASALIVFTRTGSMARNAAWLRPDISIFAFTNNAQLVNQLPLYRGITPYFMDFGEDPSANLQQAIQTLIENGHVLRGQTVVTVSEIKTRDKLIDTIQMEVAE